MISTNLVNNSRLKVLASKCRRNSSKFAHLALFFCLIFILSCGPSSNKSRNTISPYDPEFDPDKEKVSDQDLEVIESSQQPRLIKEALELYDEELYAPAKQAFDALQRQFPSSYYAPLFEIKSADASYFQGQYETAIEAYEEFIRLRPRHEAAAYARLQVGNSYFAQYKGVVFDQSPLGAAEKEYKVTISKYPGTVAAKQALKQLEKCKNLRQVHRAHVAGFYHSQGMEKASISRAKKLLQEIEGSEELLGSELHSQLERKLTKEEVAALELVRRQNEELHKQTATKASKASESRKYSSLRTRALLRDKSTTEQLPTSSSSNFLSYSCFSNKSSEIIELILPSTSTLSANAISLDDNKLLNLGLPKDKSYQLKDKPSHCIYGVSIASIKQETFLDLRSLEDKNLDFLLLDRPLRLLLLIKK